MRPFQATSRLLISLTMEIVWHSEMNAFLINMIFTCYQSILERVLSKFKLWRKSQYEE